MNEKYGWQNVNDYELRMVEGGGIWNWVKKAARWVKDHVWVDFGSRSGGIKGKF